MWGGVDSSASSEVAGCRSLLANLVVNALRLLSTCKIKTARRLELTAELKNQDRKFQLSQPIKNY